MTLKLLPIDRDGDVLSSSALPESAQQVCESTARLYQRAGFNPPWNGYLAKRDLDIVGACAFKSSPIDNQVEIAYYTFADYEGDGVATAMASALVRIARKAMPDITLMAQTEPRPNASNSILQNLGFRFTGALQHPDDGEVWEWRLTRP